MQLRTLLLNERAARIARDLLDQADAENVNVHTVAGATVLDLGVEAIGSLSAGRKMSEVCLAGLGEVRFSMSRLGNWPCGLVTVSVAEPTLACLLSQYAGWKVTVGDFFAMASGPMRRLYAKEPIFEQLGGSEKSEQAVGVFETSRLPDEEVIAYLCESTAVEPEGLILLVARTASLAGSFQIVARSVETCMHKLLELGGDVTRIRVATGSAFLPPVPTDDLTAIGRTNDSILYGSEVILWVEDEDSMIADLSPRIPASASEDYGEPFANIFDRYGGDFYAIDPMLFSPAVVVINDLSTGSCHRFGNTNHELLIRSFFEEDRLGQVGPIG